MPFRCPQSRPGAEPQGVTGAKGGKGCPCGLWPVDPGPQHPTAPGPMSGRGQGCSPHSYPQEAVPGLLPLPSAGPASPSALRSPHRHHLPLPMSPHGVSALCHRCASLEGDPEPQKVGVGLLHGFGSGLLRGCPVKAPENACQIPDKWKLLSVPSAATPASWEC